LLWLCSGSVEVFPQVIRAEEGYYKRCDLTSVERLERFWRNFVLTFPPWATEMDGPVVICYPEVPIYPANHAADIDVSEDEAENMLKKVNEYFLLRGSSYTCFRISPLTRPKSFTFLLENHGFKRKSEESVMVFKGKRLEDKLKPDIKVKETSKSEMNVYNKLMFTIFEMPIEWKKGWDKLIPIWIKKGMKSYLAYVERKPVGIASLFSSMKTGCIFNLGTLKEYRKRGIGTTLTAKTVMDSIKEGNSIHTLQAEKGGNAERLYKEIGFEIDHTISFYVKSFHDKN